MMKTNTEIDKGLSDFIQSVEITRKENIAEIIVDYYQGHPIRLIGFKTDSEKTDFQILEEGYSYYNELKLEINGIN